MDGMIPTNLSELQTGCCAKGDPECFCKSEHVARQVEMGLVEWRGDRLMLSALGVVTRANTAPLPRRSRLRFVWLALALGLIVWAVGRWG